MTPPFTIVAILSGGFALLMLWYLFFWLYRDYRLDAFRQTMFALRDELWDYAAAGHIGFDHPAYLLSRQLMNGMIRFGHNINLTWLIVAITVQRIRPTPRHLFTMAFKSASSTLAPSTRRDMERFLMRAEQIVILHIVLSSPVFWISVLPVLFVAIIRVAWAEGARKLARWFPAVDLIEREAAQLGALA